MTPLPNAILKDPAFVAIHEARELNADRARAYQATYRRLTRIFILATMCAAVLGGLVLYGLDGPADGAETGVQSTVLARWVTAPLVHNWLIALQAVALAIVAFCGYRLTSEAWDERWLEARMKAEDGRIKRAMTALDLGWKKGPEMARACGDYLLEELLDGQMDYFFKALSRHDKRARQLAIFGAITTAVSVLAVSLGGINSSSLILIIAFVGLLSPAFVAAIKSWNESTADRELAKNYGNSWESLNALRARRAEFDEAIAQGDHATTRAFADEIAQVLRADHSEFEKLRQRSIETRQKQL